MRSRIKEPRGTLLARGKARPICGDGCRIEHRRSNKVWLNILAESG